MTTLHWRQSTPLRPHSCEQPFSGLVSDRFFCANRFCSLTFSLFFYFMVPCGTLSWLSVGLLEWPTLPIIILYYIVRQKKTKKNVTTGIHISLMHMQRKYSDSTTIYWLRCHAPQCPHLFSLYMYNKTRIHSFLMVLQRHVEQNVTYAHHSISLLWYNRLMTPLIHCVISDWKRTESV